MPVGSQILPQNAVQTALAVPVAAVAALRPPSACKTHCRTCGGLGEVFRRDAYLSWDTRLSPLQRLTCETCKGEGLVPAGSEIPQAGINAHGQACCRWCGWVFHEGDNSEQCDECGGLSRRALEEAPCYALIVTSFRNAMLADGKALLFTSEALALRWKGLFARDRRHAFVSARQVSAASVEAAVAEGRFAGVLVISESNFAQYAALAGAEVQA